MITKKKAIALGFSKDDEYAYSLDLGKVVGKYVGQTTSLELSFGDEEEESADVWLFTYPKDVEEGVMLPITTDGQLEKLVNLLK